MIAQTIWQMILSIFKELDSSYNFKVKISNELLEIKGKRVTMVDIPKGIKLIKDLFFTPLID